MSDWVVGLSTGCFYQTSIFECLESIRNAGFNLVEVCSYPKHLDYHDEEAVRRAAHLFEGLGIEAYSFHAPFAEHIDITAHSPAERERALGEILRAADAAACLGAKYFVIHPGPERGGGPADPDFLQRMDHTVSVLNQVARHCRGQNVGLVLENKLPHLFSGHIRELLWIMGAMDTVEVGVCLDTGHAFLSGDLTNVAHKLSGHLWMVHASDNRGQYDDHLPPGDGKIAWDALLSQLSRNNFQGALIQEIAGDKSREEVLAGARRGRRHLRELARNLTLARLRGQ